MKRIALALALGALSTTAAMAASGDVWRGSSRDIIVEPTTPYTYVEPAPLPSDRVTVYYDAPPTTAPVIVERSYVTQPYDTVVVETPRYYPDGSPLFHVEPRKYGTVENGGLFPRRGPNDFGS